MSSRNIMRPTSGLQDMTSWRMLSGDVSLADRFEPQGPYEQAFEAGGWNSYISKLQKEKKKKAMATQQAGYEAGNLREIIGKLPSFLDYMKKNELSGFNVAVPNPYARLWE